MAMLVITRCYSLPTVLHGIDSRISKTASQLVAMVSYPAWFLHTKKRTGKIHHAIKMGKCTIFLWAIFNSYVKLPEGYFQVRELLVIARPGNIP